GGSVRGGFGGDLGVSRGGAGGCADAAGGGVAGGGADEPLASDRRGGRGALRLPDRDGRVERAGRAGVGGAGAAGRQGGEASGVRPGGRRRPGRSGPVLRRDRRIRAGLRHRGPIVPRPALAPPGRARAVTIPDGVRRGVAAALEEGFGAAAGRFQVSRVGGGCISPAARVETAAGDVAFLKWGARGRPAGRCAGEAEGLRALAATGEVRVPEVLAVFDEAGEDAWILLEWLEPGRAIEPSFERLGRDLAAMHRSRSTTFGWKTDGFIGTLPQANGE